MSPVSLVTYYDFGLPSLIGFLIWALIVGLFAFILGWVLTTLLKLPAVVATVIYVIAALFILAGMIQAISGPVVVR